jgi:hypothetical protein
VQIAWEALHEDRRPPVQRIKTSDCDKDPGCGEYSELTFRAPEFNYEVSYHNQSIAPRVVREVSLADL